MQMTKERLKQYRSLKKEIEGLEKIIENLEKKRENIPYVIGKVVGSSREFPYIQQHFSVQMVEPRREDAISERIRIKEQRKEEAEALLLEIENFIKGIPDSTDRQIFELIFLEGKKQREVSEMVNLEQSSVSKRITKQLSYNS